LVAAFASVDAIDIALRNGGGLKTAATKPVWSFSAARFSEGRPRNPEKCREDETLLARSSPSPELPQKNARSTDAFAVSLRKTES
jgi:hypothetical protein